MRLMCPTNQGVIPKAVFKTVTLQLVMRCANSNTTSGLRLTVTGFRDITQVTPRGSRWVRYRRRVKSTKKGSLSILKILLDRGGSFCYLGDYPTSRRH